MESVLVAPGNAGTATEPEIRNVDVSAEDIEGLLELAQAEKVDLTVVGPEMPVVAGIVDRFDRSIDDPFASTVGTFMVGANPTEQPLKKLAEERLRAAAAKK